MFIDRDELRQDPYGYVIRSIKELILAGMEEKWSMSQDEFDHLKEVKTLTEKLG